MILKQLRLSRHYSQEQLAQMSGLSVRTIQRIESGKSASLESLKCLAAVLEVSVSELNQENYMIDKNSDNWRNLPLLLKCWFFFNYLNTRPTRASSRRVEVIAHASGFTFCLLGLVSEPALIGGLILLSIAYLFHFLTRQGDYYGIWYE
ncbi:MAG: helix-turn-helix transcriptional regulator [Pseudomonadota bacterium]